MLRCALLIITVLLLPSAVGAQELSWENISREVLGVRVALVEPEQGRVIYLGAEKGVYKSSDAGGEYRSVLIPRGQSRRVNFLLFEALRGGRIYVATGNGLYLSSNQGRSWKRIFKGASIRERDCTTVDTSGGSLYLGTKSGLFISDNQGRTWYKLKGKLGDSEISGIAHNKEGYIYVSSSDGVFRGGGETGTWERIFTPIGMPEERPSEESYTDEEEETIEIRQVITGGEIDTEVFLATSSGVYRSKNRGTDWERLTEYGLLSQEANYLLIGSDSVLYAVCGSGVFKYGEDRWYELSLGLAAQKIFSLSMDQKGNLYAACDKGLFKAEKRVTEAPPGAGYISFYSQGEPEIKEVQEMAIKYAEVEPEKIMRWRKLAAKRAWLPRVTVEMDRDNNQTTSASIWGSSAGRYFTGPDDQTAYRNHNWGVSCTWELGDLIWSGDQTSIDVRSKLMVQLRDDILDEVTKTYFERLRVKMELDNLSIEQRSKRMQKELKLQELSASLDALTGGCFSAETIHR